MSIAGNDLLSQIENSDPKLGQYLRRYVLPAIQTTARNAAVSPSSKLAKPVPPNSVTVSPATSGDMFQVVVNHDAEIQKGGHYIYSIATNPQMTNAQIEAKPATRAPAHFPAPTFASDGSTKHSYYIGVQFQYPGSDPSDAVFHGGASPVAVQLNGTASADIMAGTGSGTAQNGGQTLVGLGKSQVRLK